MRKKLIQGYFKLIRMSEKALCVLYMSIHISTKIHIILLYIISDFILYHIMSNFKDSTTFEIIAFFVILFLLIRIMSWIRITRYPLHPFLSYPQCNKILTQFLPISFTSDLQQNEQGFTKCPLCLVLPCTQCCLALPRKHCRTLPCQTKADCI